MNWKQASYQKLLKSKWKEFYRQCVKRGKKVLITINEFDGLINGNCHYCDREPHQMVKNKDVTRYFNGIDRRNNDIDYVLNNCVSCCGICNMLKGIQNEPEFLNFLNSLNPNEYMIEWYCNMVKKKLYYHHVTYSEHSSWVCRLISKYNLVEEIS